MSDYCEHVLSWLKLNVTEWGQDKGPTMLQLHHITMIGFNHYVRINESLYHNEYWNMQKCQYQGQCQYSFYPYTSIHVFNWENIIFFIFELFIPNKMP